MNVANLILNLKSEVDNNACNQQMISKAIRLLRVGGVVSVGSVSALPTAATSNAGAVYYVDYDGLYFSNGVYWFRLGSAADVVYGWGSNANGRLGNNLTTGSVLSPATIPCERSWIDISGTSTNSAAICSDGTMWTWGAGTCGVLGNSTTVSRCSPGTIVGGFTDWCQVTVGAGCTMFGIRRGGTLWSWGSNASLILGDGLATGIARSSPASVVGGFTDWCLVRAGNAHALALRTDGTLWGWGSACNGRLGEGSSSGSRSSPTSVLGGFTDWCQVSAGNFHSLGVRTNCTLWTWGQGSLGRLGNNCTSDQTSPIQVSGGFTDWCQGLATNNNSLGIRTNGSLWAWGSNSFGALGDNSATDRSSPVSVVGGFTDWCKLPSENLTASGLGMAIRTNGTLWAWGYNSGGQLGNQTTTSTSSPVSVSGGFTDWFKISGGPLAVRRINQ